LTGFVEFFAYRAEERKYNLRYNQNADVAQDPTLNKPISVE